jgi:hypothetical protein
MKYGKHLAFLSLLALLFPAASFARDKNQHNVDIPESVQVGSTHLKAGNYKVEWQGDGPAVQVKFLKNGKLVASASGTLQTNDQQVTQDDIVVGNDSTRSNVLEEIDFGHNKEAIILGRG